MLKSGYGRIVNVASIAGVIASVNGPHYAAYAASKAGIMGLTRELAASWGRQGIRVNAIAPGYFHSRLAERHASLDAAAQASRPGMRRAGRWCCQSQRTMTQGTFAPAPSVRHGRA